jgi:hypothetical protein
MTYQKLKEKAAILNNNTCLQLATEAQTTFFDSLSETTQKKLRKNLADHFRLQGRIELSQQIVKDLIADANLDIESEDFSSANLLTGAVESLIDNQLNEEALPYLNRAEEIARIVNWGIPQDLLIVNCSIAVSWAKIGDYERFNQQVSFCIDLLERTKNSMIACSTMGTKLCVSIAPYSSHVHTELQDRLESIANDLVIKGHQRPFIAERKTPKL